ncbi:MAG: SapC family protein [Alphaproteobacteria bacterium]|nr:SapC family protein [Alphaproteobacteria bacterium]
MTDMTQTASNAVSNLPLFFQQPVPLDMKRHAKAGLMPGQNLSFSAATNSILINAVEFVEAAKHYPIVFTLTDLPAPAVVLGLEQRNYFVDAEGEWKEGAYVPAYVRKYPFVFMEVPERQQFLLCIDEGTPLFRKNGGKGARSFYEEEKPSELTRNALEFCTAFHNHYQLTRQFAEALKASDLLTPTQSDTKLFNGREIHLGGFQVVDEKKVAAMPEATVLEFHKKGWLPLLYFALMSASNWRKLADMAAERDRSPKRFKAGA